MQMLHAIQNFNFEFLKNKKEKEKKRKNQQHMVNGEELFS